MKNSVKQSGNEKQWWTDRDEFLLSQFHCNNINRELHLPLYAFNKNKKSKEHMKFFLKQMKYPNEEYFSLTPYTKWKQRRQKENILPKPKFFL